MQISHFLKKSWIADGPYGLFLSDYISRGNSNYFFKHKLLHDWQGKID